MRTRCCIAGGGPAGMMLGLLLARSGIDTVVLEKHSDFLRDFRGDTVHPSTLELMGELGLLEQFLSRPHQRIERLSGQIGDHAVTLADFSHLPERCGFIALMPQWEFLDFLAGHARRYPGFHLHMSTEARELLLRDGRIAGVRAQGSGGPLQVEAELTVAADGRHSVLRERAGLRVKDLGAPMDVLWMRLSRRTGDPGQALGRIDAGRIFVMIDRGDYWQCGYVIRKGAADELRSRGIEAFRAAIVEIAPYMQDRVGELRSWDDVKLLSVAVDRLVRWHRDGLLCIGDAAHAMSPVGGVGINLAVQDAVAAANVLVPAFQRGVPTETDLQRVQKRRELPTRLTQALQLLVQKRIIGNVLASGQRPSVPWPARLLQRWPALRRIPARLIGMGIRPEHIRTASHTATPR